ncbi:polysaccharide biosynthesis protein [Nostoc sp.]|uniref:polysaccharide biosynthesis protein n=1 Tax=Nostoc sp. TaxID=1180 RepID=UPI0035930F0A
MSIPFVTATIVYRIKILSKFISVQLVVQVLGLASGILLVRTLDQQQYAYFTIANTMQGTMNVLADSGISSGLSSIGGRVWQDPHRFGQLINTAMQLRRYLAVIAITVVTPILLWMLTSNGSSITYAVFILVLVLVGLNFQLTTVVLGIVPRLRSQINRIQQLDLIAAISRLVLLGVTYFTLLNAALAILTASIAFGLQNFFLTRWVSEYIDKKASINVEDKLDILKIIKWQAPNTIFYCIQGQTAIWLISIFGNTQSIAEVGALGRISVIFSIINSITSSIVIPAFVRCQSVRVLWQRYWQIIGYYGLLTTGTVVISIIFPRQLLWILGNQYSHLENELTLILFSTTFSSWAGTLWSINASKAWLKHNWVYIPTTITTQVILLLFLDISNVKGVIVFGIISIIPGFLLNFSMAFEGFKEGFSN